MMNLASTASERLALSRERMRLALQEVASPLDQFGSDGAENDSASWLNSRKTTPGANMLVSLVQDWWSRQPLRLSLALACDATQLVLQPIAQRHPLGLVVGAAAAGALIVLTKPWRLVPKSALWSGLLPPLMAQLMQLTKSVTTVSDGAKTQ